MAGLDLQVDGRARPPSRASPSAASQQRLADAVAATLGHDVELVEPCRPAAVLERPQERQRREADQSSPSAATRKRPRCGRRSMPAAAPRRSPPRAARRRARGAESPAAPPAPADRPSAAGRISTRARSSAVSRARQRCDRRSRFECSVRPTPPASRTSSGPDISPAAMRQPAPRRLGDRRAVQPARRSSVSAPRSRRRAPATTAALAQAAAADTAAATRRGHRLADPTPCDGTEPARSKLRASPALRTSARCAAGLLPRAGVVRRTVRPDVDGLAVSLRWCGRFGPRAPAAA